MLGLLDNSTTLLFLQIHPYITEIQVVPKPLVNSSYQITLAKFINLLVVRLIFNIPLEPLI